MREGRVLPRHLGQPGGPAQQRAHEHSKETIVLTGLPGKRQHRNLVDQGQTLRPAGLHRHRPEAGPVAIATGGPQGLALVDEVPVLTFPGNPV